MAQRVPRPLPDSLPVNAAKRVRFNNAIHEAYSDLNDFEREFAEALDKTKKTWCRNPSQGGFEIPLLHRGNTKTFNPDFLVWADAKRVVAIDPKGDQLITQDSGRKLFHIDVVGDGSRLDIRLVTEGEWKVTNGQPGKLGGSKGYTVWSLKNGKTHAMYCRTVAKAVEACLQA